MRANFTIWHDDSKNKHPNGIFYAMFDESNKKAAREILHFPRGSRKINQLMNGLLPAIKQSDPLFDGLFEVRFLTTLTDQASITLCYRKSLHAEWENHALTLSNSLKCSIIGRSRKVKKVVGGSEEIEEVLNVNGKQFRYFLVEGAFSQPNSSVCEHMLSWAQRVTAPSQTAEQGQPTDDMLELYCGGGTFTIVCASNFRKVLATEISKVSVELALKAIKENNIENVKVARLSSEEFTMAFDNVRRFQRLAEAGIESLSEYNISTVLVDPPRAGLDDGSCSLISRFDKIIYISCNPVTLARDVSKLRDTHDIERVAAFDQFPYTHHLESGIVLKRRVGTHSTSIISGIPSSNCLLNVEDKAEEDQAERAKRSFETTTNEPSVEAEKKVKIS